MDESETGTAVVDCDHSTVSRDSSVFSVHDSVGQWFSHRGPGAGIARNPPEEESEPQKID